MAVAETQERFRMSDGFELFCRRWKPEGGAKRSALCFHGIELHSGAFAFLGTRLAGAGTDVRAVDYRGFGNSKEEGLERGDVRDFGRHLEDLVEAARAIRKEGAGLKLFLFGHSIGTTYVLAIAAHHPELVDGIILAAPPLRTGIAVPASDLLGIALGAKLSPRKRYDFFGRWPSSFRDGEKYRAVRDDSLCPKDYSVSWMYNVSTKLTGKMLQNASQVRMPSLVIHGAQDDVALPEGVREFYNRLAAGDKELRTFPDADHHLYDTVFVKPTAKFDAVKGEAMAAEINGWLEKH